MDTIFPERLSVENKSKMAARVPLKNLVSWLKVELHDVLPTVLHQHSMTLSQPRFLLDKSEFELTENALCVTLNQLGSSRRYQVPFKEIDTNFQYVRRLPITTLLVGLIWLVVSLLALGCLLMVIVSDRGMPDTRARYIIGFGAGFFAAVWITLVCGYFYCRRNVDYVVVHARIGGRPLVNIHRLLPSEQHVKEFLEILKEKVEQAKFH